MEGLLPPNSREIGSILSDAALIISFPTSVDPVNESLLISLLCEIGAPHSGPVPVSKFNTPFGKNF